MTEIVLESLGRRWIEAWNSRDLDRILALYAEDAEMTSDGIIRNGLNAEGRLSGKADLRRYWAMALERLPRLHFTLLDVSASPDSVVVRYRNERGHTVAEYMRLDDNGLIVQGSANHLIGQGAG